MTEPTPVLFEADEEEGAAARLLRWLVTPGDEVSSDQPLAEIETDKVTLEVAAPRDGVVGELAVPEGSKVEPGQVLCHLTGSGADASRSAAEQISSDDTLFDVLFEPGEDEASAAKLANWLVEVGASVQSDEPVCEVETDKVVLEVVAGVDGVLAERLIAVGQEINAGDTLARIAAGEEGPSRTTQPREMADKTPSVRTEVDPDAVARERLSPAVRRIVSEHNVDLDAVNGSGRDGRVTKHDLLAYLDQRPAAARREVASDGGSRRVPHSPMRQSIARHTADSLLRISPHVTSVFEADMSRVVAHRARHKGAFADKGIHLTYTAYFLAAATVALREVPQVNARFHEDHLEMFDAVHIGVGTALGDEGLVAPVVRDCQERSLGGIARALAQRTEQARTGKLSRADMEGGTFTISNHGVSGSLFAAPIIINQPQVAILGVGKMEKRIRVETVDGEDTIRIRPMCYVTLSIDHRALDAFQTNRWLSAFVAEIEGWNVEKAGL